VNLKDGWNASNYNLYYLPQVITFQCHILCFDVRQRNLQALTQPRENIAAAYKVLPSGADQAAPMCPQSYAKPEFMGPQNRHVGKHPDTMIKDFKASLENTQDAAHCVAIYTGTREFTKLMSRHKTYILDEQLHAMALCIYHGIQVHVEGLDVECISQMCCCTRSQSQRGAGSTERLGVGEAMPREMLWCTKRESPVAAASTIQNQPPIRRFSFL
jgi:hypothetical protein